MVIQLRQAPNEYVPAPISFEKAIIVLVTGGRPFLLMADPKPLTDEAKLGRAC